MRTGFIAGSVLVCLCGTAMAVPVVVGGSSLVSPPPYWDGSFWGMTSAIERAFPFTVVGGGPFKIEQAQVVAYHYAGLAGDRASFTINADNGGSPGAILGVFQTTSISTAPQVVTMPALSDVVLQSGSRY